MKFLILLLALSCATKKVESPEGSEDKEVFTTHLSHDWIKELVRVSNCTIARPNLKKDLEAIESFEHTDDSGREVAGKLSSKKARVDLYTASWFAPWKNRVFAYAENGVIYFNTRTNPREMRELVKTAMHEVSHLWGYSHNGNGHDSGVPRAMEKLAAKHVEDCL